MDTQREPKSWAMIAIYGPKVNPVEISAKLGMEADYFHGSDTKDINNLPLTPHWQINSSLSPNAGLNDHIWELLKRLAPVRKAMKEFTTVHESCLYASVEYASREVKGIHIDKRTMLLLGEMGIHLEISPWLDVESRVSF